ncbi:hypothetical protein G6F60_008619 [Rhizopus arrhizus]|nr:hypothetical protein G6F61_008020 [Rhizopus arrhizus]KAG1398034.1 hypothetical protein G6F60_008619 [Rhizopus arrhizus]
MSNTTAFVRDNFDSISEGCFLVMPSKKRKLDHEKPSKKKIRTKEVKITHRSESDNSNISHNGFQQLFDGNEPEDTLLYRKRSFYEAWTKIDKMMNDVLVDMNQKTYSNIRQFVDKAHDIKEGMICLPFHEIPTALVFAGINTPDHAAQFAHIASDLKQPLSETNERKRKNFVSFLQAKDCSNIKNMIKTMIERFLENTNEVVDQTEREEEDDNEDDDIIRTAQPPTATSSYQIGKTNMKESKALPYDIQLLEGWYKHHSSSDTLKPNLVVILQDFEAFEPNVLQDFFTICSEYQMSLPIVCIVGIATSTEILHQSLSKSTIGLLRIERFKLENSEVWFNRVIEKIFLDTTNTLKFGPRPYKFLLDHFYLYDFSITKVSASLKYALIHYFYGNPLSIFLPLLELDKQKMEEKLKEQFEKRMLTIDHINSIRMLPSFKAYIELLATTKPKKALSLLEDDEKLIKEVPRLLTHIKQYQIGFTLGIHLIQLLQSQFPSFSSMRKSKRMIFLEALEAKEEGGFASQSQLVKVLVSLLRKIDVNGISKLLKEMRTLFEQKKYTKINKEALSKLNEWDTRLLQLENSKGNTSKKKMEGMILSNIENEHGRHTVTAQKVQNESMEYIKKLGTEKSKLAIEIADWCNDYLGHCLQSFTQKPLYEIVYYTSARLLEKSFASQPRATVQTGLTQPRYYLNCACCKNDKADQLLTSEPDSCLLYKLYLECGRMINLYDWFIAFSSIIEKEQRAKNKPVEENEAQARFIRSVAELQFLGFIKPTQRKTDHVMRLTWSNI